MNSSEQQLTQQSAEKTQDDSTIPIIEGEHFDKINKLLQKAEIKILQKQDLFGHTQLKRQIELYEMVITELGIELSKQDLLPYANIMQKIFQGFRMLYKKVQKVPIKNISEQDFEIEHLNTQGSFQLYNQTGQNFGQFPNMQGLQQQQQQQQQFQQQQQLLLINQQQQQQQLSRLSQSQSSQTQLPQINGNQRQGSISNLEITNNLSQQNNNNNVSELMGTPQNQQQKIQQQFSQQQQKMMLNNTDGFQNAKTQSQLNQKNIFINSPDQQLLNSFRQQTQATLSTTQTSNFNNMNRDQFEGNLGGVLLDSENQTAFTEIIYDENAVTFKPGQQNNNNSSNNNKKEERDPFATKKISQSKYSKSNQLFRRKNYDDRPKLLAHKGTDTGQDFLNAMKDWDFPQKMQQLQEAKEESEENIKELNKQLENKAKFVNKDYSKVDKTLDTLVKLLKQRQFDTAQFFAKSTFDKNPQVPESNLPQIKKQMDLEFYAVQRQTAQVVFDYINMCLRDKDARRVILNQTDSSSQNIKGKGDKKGGKSSEDLKKQQALLDELQKKVKEAEKAYQDSLEQIEKRDSDVINLQIQIQSNENQVHKLKNEIDMNEKLSIKQNKDYENMDRENKSIKIQQDVMKNEKNKLQKQAKEMKANLQQEKEKATLYQTENKKLKSALDVIRDQTKKMPQAEQAQITQLCTQIMDSNLSEEQQYNLLQQISDFYNGKGGSSRNDQKNFSKHMMNQIEKASNRGSQLADFSDEDIQGGAFSDNYNGKNQKKKLIQNNLKNKAGNLTSGDERSPSLLYPEKLIQPAMMEMEYVEVQADGTKVVKKQQVMKDKMQIGAIVKDNSGQAVKIVGYEKKKIIQKKMQKVQKTRKVLNDQGEEVDEQYEEEEEVEVEVEIEIPIHEKVDLQAHNQNIKKNKKSSIINSNHKTKNTTKFGENNDKKGSNATRRISTVTNGSQNQNSQRNIQINQNGSQQNNNINSSDSYNNAGQIKAGQNSQFGQNNNKNQGELRQILVEKEIEEEIEEIQIDSQGNKTAVKKIVKKKIKVPVQANNIDSSRLRHTESGTEYMQEDDFKFLQNQQQKASDEFQIKHGKAQQKVKKIVQKVDESGKLVDVEEEVLQDLEGDIIAHESGKKFLKTKVMSTVKKTRKNSKGEDEEYLENIEKEVFYEVDDDGNVLREMQEEEGNQLNQSIIRSQNNSKAALSFHGGNSPHKGQDGKFYGFGDKGQNKKEVTIQKKVQVQRQRQNSKGEMESYMIEEIVEEKIMINEDEKVDPNTGQIMHKKIIKEKIKKERKNSKGEIEQYYEEVERQVYTPNKVKMSTPAQNKQYLEEIENSIQKERKVLHKETEQNIKNKSQKIIKGENGKQILQQKQIVKKQRKNSKGQIEEYEEEQEVQIELKEGETIDAVGNIIDSKTGKILKSSSKIYQDGTLIQSQNQEQNYTLKKSNFSQNMKQQQQECQTDIQLMWPIIAVILQEVGVDPSKMQAVYQKYFMANANPADIAQLMQKQAEIYLPLNGDNSADGSQENMFMPKNAKFNALNNNNKNLRQGNNMNQVTVEEKYIDPKTDQLLKLFDPPLNEQEREQEENELYNRQLKVLEDKALLMEPTIKKLYLQLRQAKDKHVLEVRTKIRQFYGKDGDGYVSYDEFKNYYLKMMTVHNRCGDGCVHLSRFFAKIGFTANKFSRRRELRPSKQKPIPFSENNENNPDNILKNYEQQYQSAKNNFNNNMYSNNTTSQYY